MNEQYLVKRRDAAKIKKELEEYGLEVQRISADEEGYTVVVKGSLDEKNLSDLMEKLKITQISRIDSE